MRSATRSTTGALLALAIIPFVIGLLACMPVPIGNPERSRIDPGINGVWRADDAFYAFEPYDKRTWLLIGVPDAFDNDWDRIVIYKAWRSKHGGEWFMTWEPKAQFENEGFLPDYWGVFRIDRPDPDQLVLRTVDASHEVFEGVDETRRAYERVLRKHARNPDIYDDEPPVLVRPTEEELAVFQSNLERMIQTD